MKSLFRVAFILLAAGIGFLATGILLTADRTKATFYPFSGPNWSALLGLLVGSLMLWLGCIGIALVLRCSLEVLAALPSP